ncbi:MAG: TolC family protein [Planctomycetota bacterium]
MRFRPFFPCLVLAVYGCSAADYAADADQEVGSALAEATERALGGRRESVVQPEPAKSEAEPAAAPAEPSEDAQPQASESADSILHLDLEAALRTAIASNRELASEREQLYQQGLQFTGTRFEFGPQLASTVAAVWNDRETSRGILSLDGRAAVRQILPTGGSVSLDGGLGFDHFVGPLGDGFTTNGAVRLRQPLLQGAGYTASHEAWTRAQRELVYAVRRFELFRQRLSIDIARDYFGLISQKQTLANQERTYQDAVFDRRKAEALFSVDRNDEQQVFRARRREIVTENELIDARAAYKRALDAFRVRLGLPVASTIDVVSQTPEFVPIDMDDDSAVRAALANRLDLLSQREQVEDVERQLAIAENGLLPDFNLDASYSLDGSGPSLDRASPHDWSSSIGLTMEVPLQRTRERNSLRNAQIALDRARRGLTQQCDQLDIEVRDQLRQLRSIEQQLVLQREQIEQEKKAVAVMQIRYESGNVDNRDLLEARQALIQAENALIRLEVDHFVRRLELHRTLGVLFIDEQGMWQ